MPTIDELAATTPTLEEMLFSTTVPCWNNAADKISASTAMTLLVAPMPLRILSCALSFEYWNIASSDSRYWRAELTAGTNPTGFRLVATRTTQNTGANANGGITARKGWLFDAAAWGPAELAVGEVLRLTATPVGDPVTDWDFPMTVTIRYRPL